MKNQPCDNEYDLLKEPIAIVGANCQFPGMDNDIEDLHAFYEMLLKEQTPIRDVPANRWDITQYYDPDRQKEDKIVSRRGGFLNDPRLFDAAFFKIPPIEAKQMDPQHRVFLEVAIRALNNANITLDSLKDTNTGVYCGLSTNDYSQLNHKDKIHFDAYTCIGSAGSAAAGRLSYFLNLKGPCVTIDTACSSSMSALYLATTALRTQQCHMVIAGGVHLSLCPEASVGLSKANMLSAVGECRSFDAEADGYVRSEGCAVVILKRLSDAIKDRNPIHAVIKNIIMNQDGGGASLAAPNIEAQIAMHQDLLEQAHLDARDIDYIETHGTGTVRGDAVEFQAIQSIHQGKHSKDKPLIIGALKSNLGHTISASGIAALIKVIGAFKQEKIAANLHYSTPNASIDPHSIPALFPIHAIPFPKQPNKKRLVQLSNFGFTGTNVSALIEEPPSVMFNEFAKDSHAAACFVISANTEFSLHQMLKSHLSYLKTSSASLSDLCATLIHCRDHYKWRCAIIAQDKASLIQKIESGDYSFKKTSVDKEITWVGNDAKQNFDYFLSGANLRWDKNNNQFNPVDLPLYCFDRKTYWHDIRANQEIKIPEDWCFELTWQHQPINKSHHIGSNQRWLFMGDQHHAFSLEEKGLTLIRETDQNSFHNLEGIIFAEGFNSSPSEDINSRVEFQKNTLKKILALLQALDAEAIQLRLIFLTAHSPTQRHQDSINLDSSPLAGFCKTLCLELPQYQTILIHLDKNQNNRVAEQILDEIHYNHGQYYEHMISYRNSKRLVSRLKKSPLPKETKLCHPEGRYLITGGCGGLGLITAQALLSAGARELVLVSRTTDEPSILTKIKKIQSDYPDRMIRAMNLDISDKARVNELLLAINEDGLLKGIIHAAGASINKTLLQHQAEDIDHLFSAKVKGGWYLHELSQNIDLDFFIVYSSIASVFGSNKESIYSGTNSFLDALISERQRLGLVGTAIQWGPWAEVGMAKKRSRHQGLKEALIHNDQGQAFIKRLISHDLNHATIISPAYLQFMLDFVPVPRPAFYENLASDLGLVAPSPNTALSSWLHDYAKIDAQHQLTACKTMVSEICQEILELEKTDDLDEEEGFFELGLDSLMMAELATRLKENLKPLLHVVATIAFDYPSINKLSHHLKSELSLHCLKAQTFNEPIDAGDDAIAIIGMSCSLPNAPNITAFEQLLEQGLSGIRDIPIERWDHRLYYDSNPDAPGKTYVHQLGLIDHIKLFDPQFFGISPREAPFLDPQQRLFLENCYHAIEHANYPLQSLRGSATGVFAGVGSNQEYYTLVERGGVSYEDQGMFSITGKALNIIPGRVAYTFDFKGPALSLDTACSSSLVAVHYACNSLRNHDIDFALAGGVNVLLRPDALINLSRAKALSPDGQCKTFDENANGYVRSEGCGVLFLKRMTDALRDKDTILAVIKGSAINHDGKSAGLTAPNGQSQENVMTKALRQARLAGDEISYIETHGTGTPLGDPIEVHAINAVYGKQRQNDNPLYIGSVKTNIGHLECASGVASLIKVILGLQKKKIYKNLNFNQLNRHIKLDASQIALQNQAWPSKTNLRSAGVSAFGFSGTNAHVILQEFPENLVQKESHPPKQNALVLSAKSQTALDNLVQCYQQFLAISTDDFNDLCFTAAVGRDHYSYRLAIVASDALTASQLLKDHAFYIPHHNDNPLALDLDAELQLLIHDYLKGKLVDWASYYNTHQPNLSKVALPNYPFARNEFWLNTGEHQNTQAHMMTPSFAQMPKFSDHKPLESDHLYDIQWRLLDSYSLNKTTVPEFWVISKNTIKTRKILGRIRYQLVDNIDELEQVEDKNILFLYDEGQFQDLFHCCQTLFKSPPKCFILVTENAYALPNVTFGTVNPHHTMATTFWKSFKNELELHQNYALDLDSESTLSECLEEVLNAPSGENQFALRDALYVPRLKKKKLSLNATQQQKLFDPEASYLITGGTGGLAKFLIEYLLSRGVKHIILTSRSECPLDTQSLIERSTKQGVNIIHYAADASSLPQMEKVFTTIQQGFRPLKGIFHLAGMIRNDLIINFSEKELQPVFRAKQESALILHQLTQNMALDWFVLFSSASSILGSRRQANYAAANGFLDGLAHLRHQHGLPALAINWGVFRSQGMAADTILSLEKRGFIPLDERSIDILDLLLRSDLPQIVVCPIQWDVYFKNTSQNLEFSEQHETKSLSGQEFLNSLQQRSSKEQSEILSRILCDIAADVLGLDDLTQLTPKTDLFSMGMDSLMSLELRSRIHDQLQCPGLSLPIEYFINDPRIDKITSNIAKELTQLLIQHQDNTTTDHVRAGAVALTASQYGFWLVNKMNYSFNCPKQIQLHGKLNRDYLSKAFAFTINQNGAFWLNFHKDIPIQMPKRQGQFIINYEDRSSCYHQETLNDLFYENTMKLIPLTQQPLIRVYLYKLKEELHELQIIIPHIILDESSYRILFEQLKNNYHTLLLGKNLISVQEQYDYLDYVRHNNSHNEKDLKDKAEFWQVYNNGFQRLSFGPTHHLPDADKATQHLFHYPMDKQFIDQFKEWHRKKNMNVSTGLVAACHIVFYKISSQKKIPMMILHNDRESSRYKSVIGLFFEYKRINITLNENDNFMEFFKSIENEFIKASPFQKCSLQIKNIGLNQLAFSIWRHAIMLYHQLFFSKQFKITGLNSITRRHYLQNLSNLRWFNTTVLMKEQFNRLLHTKLRLLKPNRLNVVFNITAGFFIKEPRDNTFSDLKLTTPNYYGSIDRAIGNQTLWIYFTKDQSDCYRLSINGPLTAHCKDLIAQELTHVMTKIMENDEYQIKDLV